MAKAKYKKQFKRGRRIKSMASLSKILDAGKYVFITYGQTYVRLSHNGWTVSMSYRTLQQFVRNGKVHASINTGEKNANRT